jgi:hypothetical protein
MVLGVYLYYFCEDPRGLPELENAEFDPASPVWGIVTTLKESDRQYLAEQFAQGRAILEEHEFALTTVLHLAPCGQGQIAGRPATLHRARKLAQGALCTIPSADPHPVSPP